MESDSKYKAKSDLFWLSLGFSRSSTVRRVALYLSGAGVFMYALSGHTGLQLLFVGMLARVRVLIYGGIWSAS